MKKDGLPYITATHDRNNPRSGNVMQKVGMEYCYSYEEQWQPKDFPVVFRMYQLTLMVTMALCIKSIGIYITMILLKVFLMGYLSMQGLLTEIFLSVPPVLCLRVIAT